MPEPPVSELPLGPRIGRVMTERERTMLTRHEAETMLDCWLRTTLRERYTPALREPLPEALARLLDDADRQGAPEHGR